MAVEETRFLQLDELLTSEEHARLLEHVRGLDEFEPAQVTKPGEYGGGHDRAVRSAAVASPDQIFEVLESKLLAVLPHARIETGVPRFDLGHIERQLTAHGDGDFFDVHTDIGDPTTESASRRLSFVYYFHETPKTFAGGELRLYDSEVGDDGVWARADTFRDIQPTDNSVVFFPSWAHHEVRPVHAVDTAPPGSTRFTITGWFHEAPQLVPQPELRPEQRTALTERYTPSFTEHGFEKVKTPPDLHRRLRAIYDELIAAPFTESVGQDDPYLSDAPDFLDIEDVKHELHEELRAAHEAWSGLSLVPTAAYGLRVYRRGQSLRRHTDVLETHVISSIVHIAHDTDEPWPLRITDLHGEDHDVYLDEGEMLFYESARCPHSRPEPLDGEAYCSLFLHYRPVDWNLTYWTLVDRARADGAVELLPEDLWPAEA